MGISHTTELRFVDDGRLQTRKSYTDNSCTPWTDVLTVSKEQVEKCKECYKKTHRCAEHCKEESATEQLVDILKDCGITQVTFTGWKAELEEAEKKIKKLQFMVDNGLSEEEFYANHDTDKDPTRPLRPEDVIWVHEEALDELEGTDVSEISTADFFIGSAEELAKSSGGSPRALHYWTPFVRREKGKQPCR